MGNADRLWHGHGLQTSPLAVGARRGRPSLLWASSADVAIASTNQLASHCLFTTSRILAPSHRTVIQQQTSPESCNSLRSRWRSKFTYRYSVIRVFYLSSLTGRDHHHHDSVLGNPRLFFPLSSSLLHQTRILSLFRQGSVDDKNPIKLEREHARHQYEHVAFAKGDHFEADQNLKLSYNFS